MKYSGNYYVNFQNYQNLTQLPRILDEHWGIYSCLQRPPRENWFQYVRRVYTTAINFPCISTLLTTIFDLLEFRIYFLIVKHFLLFLVKQLMFLVMYAHLIYYYTITINPLVDWLKIEHRPMIRFGCTNNFEKREIYRVLMIRYSGFKFNIIHIFGR